MKYRIWKRFSPEARRAAATASYLTGHRVTVEGCCPLGVALRAERAQHPWTLTFDWTALSGDEVADALVDPDCEGDWDEQRQAVTDAADDFAGDWDAGRIDPADLKNLLEVTP